MRSGGSRLAAIALVAGGLLLCAPAASAASTFPSINGGTVGNSTSLPISSNGGTSLSNAAGGSDNLALTGGAGFNNGRYTRNSCRDDDKYWNDPYCWDYRRDNWDYRNNRNFRNRAPQLASAGNGGVAGSSANGGSVSLGDINSGGNAGNAISAGFPFGVGY